MPKPKNGQPRLCDEFLFLSKNGKACLLPTEESEQRPGEIGVQLTAEQIKSGGFLLARFAEKSGRFHYSIFDGKNGWVRFNPEASKSLLRQVECHRFIEKLKGLINHLESATPIMHEEDIPPPPMPWPQTVIDSCVEIGQTLSRRSKLKKLVGQPNNQPRKWTSELVARARTINREHHEELKQARQLWNFYVRQGRSKEAAKTETAKTHPNIPQSILDELLLTAPGELSREWTITQLSLDVSASRLKAILNTKADTRR